MQPQYFLIFVIPIDTNLTKHHIFSWNNKIFELGGFIDGAKIILAKIVLIQPASDFYL